MSKTTLKKRSDLHLERKIWHVTAISIVAWLNHYLSHETSFYILISVGSTFLLMDCIRLFIPALNTTVKRSLGIFMREHENTSLAGTSWFIVGLIITYLLLPKPIVTTAILMTAFVDPTASLFGVLFGKHKLYNNKSLEGFVAAILVGILVLIFCAYMQLWQPAHIWLAIPIAALAVAMVELLSPQKLDDNLTIPIAAGFCLFGLLQL